FPVGCTDQLLLPRALLHVVLLLGHLRRLLLRAFDAVGLGDLLDADNISIPFPETNTAGLTRQFQPSAVRIQEALPAVRYGELGEFEEEGGGGRGCVVCLCEFEAEAEVRRLTNCRHVFHRGCLDRWLEHGPGTCPLCRAPLLPEAAKVEEKMWTDDVPWEFYLEDLAPVQIASAAPPRPGLLLPVPDL
ncbi:brassinosteroid-responsive RING protein 1-like, partial [Curcuma longa]|uniref:brassinosteroid-responsive RING protein 1-like n=1 Tax=Curcuma longa TaxID=136217 RepID=UPI003D9F44F8